MVSSFLTFLVFFEIQAVLALCSLSKCKDTASANAIELVLIAEPQLILCKDTDFLVHKSKAGDDFCGGAVLFPFCNIPFPIDCVAETGADASRWLAELLWISLLNSAFFANFAKHFKDLRMDTQAKNERARRLYCRLGYEEIGIVSCNFNGINGIELVLLEKAVHQLV